MKFKLFIKKKLLPLFVIWLAIPFSTFLIPFFIIAIVVMGIRALYEPIEKNKKEK